MKALLTGATGFIGGSVLSELLRSGYQVRALVRKGSRLNSNIFRDVEVVFGDVRDIDSVETALDGCDVLCHAAAVYTFWTPNPRDVYETNVKGTENVLKVALAKRIEKVVYTSTESTICLDKESGLGTEESIRSPDDVSGHYKKSKCLAEAVALRMCDQGLPLVVVNPTTPVGAGDVKPTPTGQLIVDFLNGRMPAYVNTGLNLIDVADVARGHILALERGRVGERYILGNANLTFKDILSLLEQVTGLKAPRLRIPIWLALGAAYVDELVASRVAKRPPRIPVAAVKTASSFRYFDCSKAIRELGLPQTPVKMALEKAVRWFRHNGYAR